MIFTINDFEGPLDLLLHLIKNSKMDIYNIDINIITKEYLDFIDKSNLSIDESSEYLVIASELIHLKSKTLLNKDEPEEEDYEFNTSEDLTKRLLEYQKFRKVAEEFKNLEEKRSEIYTKLPSNLNEYKEETKIINSDVSLEDLISAFSNFLNRQKLSEPINTKITRKELSVEEKCNNIRAKLKIKNGKVKFLELFDSINKPDVVATFLGVLEMVKGKEIKITQENNFSDIYIESSD